VLELSPQRLRLWHLILSQARASCDFPLLGLPDIFYERLLLNAESNQVR